MTLARKASEFAEEAARKAIQKMQTEAEVREPYFVNLGDRPQPRSVEDRHMVRFGPELARGTFLCMLGPVKAAELAANKEQISWLSPVAADSGDAETSEAVQVGCVCACVGVMSMLRDARVVSKAGEQEGSTHTRLLHLCVRHTQDTHTSR